MHYNIILPLLLSIPLLTFVGLVFIKNIKSMLIIAITSNIFLLGSALYIFFFKMNPTIYNTQLEFLYTGIELLPNLSFGFAVDGISIFFIVATAVLGVLSFWYAALTMAQAKMSHYLILGTQFMIFASVGFVISADIFSFYIFWELTIIPVFFMIGIWGGANRFYHAMTLFIYTAAGTILMLIGLVLLYVIFRGNSISSMYFSILGSEVFPETGTYVQGLALILISIAFLVKLPILPLHGWLKSTYKELPVPALILVAGLIGKLGIYGLYRMNIYVFNGGEIIPTAMFLMAVLAVATIIYGSIVAFSQKEMKALIAYGSFAHIGVITLGVVVGSSVALEGAIYQVLTHGLAVAGLFILADQGEKLTGSTSLRAVKGLFRSSPRYTFFLVLFAMAFLGLPPLGTFTSELILFIGLLGSVNIYLFVGALSAVFLSAVYVMVLVQNLVFARSDNPLWGNSRSSKGLFLTNYYNKFDAEPDASFSHGDKQDLSLSVAVILGVIGVFLLGLGLFPGVLLEIIQTNDLSITARY